MYSQIYTNVCQGTYFDKDNVGYMKCFSVGTPPGNLGILLAMELQYIIKLDFAKQDVPTHGGGSVTKGNAEPSYDLVRLQKIE